MDDSTLRDHALAELRVAVADSDPAKVLAAHATMKRHIAALAHSLQRTRVGKTSSAYPYGVPLGELLMFYSTALDQDPEVLAANLNRFRQKRDHGQ